MTLLTLMENSLIFFLLASLAPIVGTTEGLAAEPVVNCADFWAKGFPVIGYEKKFLCVKYWSVPMGEGEAGVYFSAPVVSGVATSEVPDELRPVLERMKAAVIDSVGVYKDYGWMRPPTLVYTGLKSARKRGAEVPKFQGEYPESVAVMVYKDLLAEPENYQKQLIAHELFHVLQLTQMASQFQNPDSDWWVEGSADYFSGLVYPAINREFENAEAFDSDTVIFKQGYANTALFQSWANTWIGPTGVFDFLKDMPKVEETGLGVQRAAYASIPTVQLYFHQFAEEFMRTQIKDVSGVYLPTHFVGPLPVELKVGKNTIENSTEPFTISSKRLKLKKGQKAEIEFVPPTEDESKFSISARNAIGNRAFDGVYAGYPITLDGRCKKDGAELEFAMTSVLPSSGEHRSSFKVDVTESECPCKGDRPLDEKVIGRWRISNDSMKAFLSAALGGSATVDSVSGISEVEVTKDGQLIESFSQFTAIAHTDDAVITVELPDGTMRALLGQADVTAICLREAAAEVIAKLTIQLGTAAVTSLQPIQFFDDSGVTEKYQVDDKAWIIYRQLPTLSDPIPIVFYRQ